MSVLEEMKERAQTALGAWDLPEQVPELLKYRENAVFKVKLHDGASAALRLHRPGYHSEAALRSELQFMHALKQNGLAVPEPIATPEGRFLVALDGGQFADLIGWVHGSQIGESGKPLAWSRDEIVAIYHGVGAAMARMHAIADGWATPEGFERSAWDADGLLGRDLALGASAPHPPASCGPFSPLHGEKGLGALTATPSSPLPASGERVRVRGASTRDGAGLLNDAPLWGPFWDCPGLSPDDRDFLSALRAELRGRLDAIAGSLDYGLIHADLVRENVLVSDGAVAMIDFDDSGHGWRLFDVATALLRNRREPHYEALRQALIDGYRSHRRLDETELAHLPLFLLLRSLTYIGWAGARPDLPDNQERLARYVRDARELAKGVL